MVGKSSGGEVPRPGFGRAMVALQEHESVVSPMPASSGSSAWPNSPETPTSAERVVKPSVSTWLLQETGVPILREVVARCDAAAIPVLPVKGIVTSRWLYGDVAQRPITDVDVRVRAQDFRRFQHLAARAGWRCLRVALSYRNLVYDFGALSLDVEASIGPPGLCGLDIVMMMERSVRHEIAPGLRVSVPEIHDHAVLLVINAFKDKIVTAAPSSIADLERIVVQPGFRLGTFVERAEHARVATIVWLVAAYLESARGSGTWGAIRVAVESTGRVRRLYARLIQHELAAAERAPMFLRLLARVGADSRAMQVEALVRAVAWTMEMGVRGDSGGGDATGRRGAQGSARGGG